MPDVLERFGQRLGEELTAVAVALQEIERHALRGFRSHARKAAQGIDQACECRRVFQNGSFMPGGRLSPDMRPEYFSWLRAAILCTASLMAATSRSSSMSLSSPSSFGSIVTFFASWGPFRHPLPIPAPPPRVPSSGAAA